MRLLLLLAWSVLNAQGRTRLSCLLSAVLTGALLCRPRLPCRSRAISFPTPNPEGGQGVVMQEGIVPGGPASVLG